MDVGGLHLRDGGDPLTQLLYGHDKIVAAWVCERAPHAQNGLRDPVTIGVVRDGALIAAVAYSEYRGHSIEVSMASTDPRWATRRTLKAIFSYPFVQLPCERLTAYTGESMTHVRQFLERLGFQQEGIVRRGFADDNAVIYGMLKEECRWI